jgi:ABC-type dipeptide/oligopeptide/nickel transport system ATPase subunit
MKLGIFGPQGSGKSFVAMVLARSLQRQYPFLHIYTNMNVAGDNITTITDLAQMPLDLEQPKILIVDEAYFTLDSRNSSSKQNRIWSKVFAFFRKANVVLAVFITHRPRMIDINIRDQLDYVIMCRKNPTHFDYLMMDMVSHQLKPFQIPKVKEVFDFANYDTYDFPLPITVESLEQHPLFKVAK